MSSTYAWNSVARNLLLLASQAQIYENSAVFLCVAAALPFTLWLLIPFLKMRDELFVHSAGNRLLGDF